MVASTDTVKQILEVMRKHIQDEDTIRRIIRDLQKITGNASFVATMERLERLYK